ncbi:MAG TPA: 4Fe-4S binding protein, partial [Candidatus Omnitrophota bacterium]|nr:4Fe-4S binding protein [Candidatus Omnitrophota bacterium]
MRRPGKIIRQVLDHFFIKPVTTTYPREKSPMPAGFRGRLKFSAEKCIGCKMCMRDCPSSAIEIIKVADKQFKAVVNLDKCIYCGQCVDSCLKKAL